MAKKIMITGAGGYIGSISAYLFLQQGYEIVAVDNFITGYRTPLELLQSKFSKDKLRVYYEDLREAIKGVFVKEKDIEVVVHYAAACKVDESMKNPGYYFSNNVNGSLGLLEAMVENGIKNIVFSSTCAVYGEAQYSPIDEKHSTLPLNPYGESKLMTEKTINWYHQLKGINYVILRYFNVCGASDDGLIGDSKKPSSLLVQNAVRGALNIEPFYLTCPEVNTPDKTPIRDYINVVDLNEAHLKAVDYLLGGGSRDLINLGTGTGNSVLEIVHQVQEVTGKKFELTKTTPREGEYAKTIASIEKAKNVLGWEPKRSIKDSVTSLVTWYTAHPNGWEK